MAERRRLLAAAAALLAAVAGAAGASTQPDERVDRRQIVAGWIVEDVSETDGGLMVRMIRQGEDYRLEWSTSYWRGNGGPVSGATLQRGDCASGDASAIQDPSVELTAAALRDRFAEYLAECEIPAVEAANILEGFEPAFALASGWAAEAEAATAAENAAIAAYGSEPEADPAVVPVEGEAAVEPPPD